MDSDLHKVTVKIMAEELFPIVGIGASAGGLDALKQLLVHIPISSGMAFIVMQHQRHPQERLVPEILQEVTTLPIIEVVDSVNVKPDNVYIIPPDKLLVASDGALVVDSRPEEGLHVIDMFFSSLAEVHQEHAIGVVLSGEGTDGTVGLKTIKDQGGITIVQDRESASYADMPHSAMMADVVDYVLPPERIPIQLLELIRNSKILPSNFNASQELKDEEVFRNILTLLRLSQGTDFTFYKQTTIRRRILRRKGLLRIDKLKDYQYFLFENKAEQDALYKDILIPVTAFFRDEYIFNLLCEKVFPSFFKEPQSTEGLRIWIAGCSTGEEAYSMAICLSEFLLDHPSSRRIQIFATDISEASILKARTGIYYKNEMAGVSEKRIASYFTKLIGHYQIHKDIREMCVFATHNFIKDPPFSNINLISCRNVMIYLDTYLQKKALNTFHYSLVGYGFLLLGKSESAGQSSDQFEPVNLSHKLFSKKPVASPFMYTTTDSSEAKMLRQDDYSRLRSVKKDDFRKSADDAILAKFNVSGVIVNDRFNIVQFRGTTALFLEAPSGTATLNVLRMAKGNLPFELRTAFHQVKANGKVYSKKGIPVFSDGDKKVSIEVIPLKHTIERYCLILFSQDATHSVHHSEEAGQLPEEAHLSTDPYNETLKLELAQLREDMRAIIEDQEVANEELQSANEELLSGSEELQTINEELQTTKEEISSSNEELQILNQELSERNDQLIKSRRYAEAIVSTIHEPLIVLTNNFTVRTANKAFLSKFNTSIELLVGKQFFEIQEGLWGIEGLREKMQRVLPEHAYIGEIEVVLEEHVFIINARQLMNEQSNEELILVAINDVTERRSLEEQQSRFSRELELRVVERTRALEDANRTLQNLNENLLQFASIASHDLQEPLRKIKTFANILKQNALSELNLQAKQSIEKIGTSADRMSQLISEVLKYSKVIHAVKDFQPTDLNEVVKNVLIDLELMIEEKSASIRYESPLPVIDAIPLQIHQLFYNLFNNALKFTRPGIPPVISIQHRASSNDWDATNDSMAGSIEITVSDNGIGFNQQFADQIFQVFERLHSADEYQGTGIGLALCKQIVENHNGLITAKSVEGEGASFIVTIPVNQF